jgi:hypothetical protein
MDLGRSSTKERLGGIQPRPPKNMLASSPLFGKAEYLGCVKYE